mmetsp:Transcript_147597/g.257447  ORF Transcript_147597/g.257447 Transcript_147597/m.257447 type:complete len:259 (-) Transcript_147597:11-787(-)
MAALAERARATSDALTAASSSTALAVVDEDKEAFTEEELLRYWRELRHAARAGRLQEELDLRDKAAKRKAPALADAQEVTSPSNLASDSVTVQARPKKKSRAGTKAKPWSSLEKLDQSIDHARAVQMKKFQGDTSLQGKDGRKGKSALRGQAADQPQQPSAGETARVQPQPHWQAVSSRELHGESAASTAHEEHVPSDIGNESKAEVGELERIFGLDNIDIIPMPFDGEIANEGCYDPFAPDEGDIPDEEALSDEEID